MTTPLVQAIARALCVAQGCAASENEMARASDEAQAALTAITEAGYAVVPVEADADMMTAGEPLSAIADGDTKGERVLRRLNAAAIYRAMISATNTGKGGA